MFMVWSKYSKVWQGRTLLQQGYPSYLMVTRCWTCTWQWPIIHQGPQALLTQPTLRPPGAWSEDGTAHVRSQDPACTTQFPDKAAARAWAGRGRRWGTSRCRFLQLPAPYRLMSGTGLMPRYVTVSPEPSPDGNNHPVGADLGIG